MKICGIYAIVADNKVYIGASSDIKKRWSYHKSRLRSNKHFLKDIQEVFNKDKNCVEFIILQECKFEELDKYEALWIEKAKLRGFEVLNKLKPLKIKKITNPDILKRMSQSQRGELNGNARLKKNDVIKIKKMLKKGVCYNELAKEFNVSIPHICRIKNGKKWKHIVV